ncbi:MAG TPA: hypothetical protein VLA34_07875, partial [Candidatus Krumholzibacterium sp.]|nr:hypothetical protein [Candidatus Krumholzibacterium sp.]
MKYSRLSAVCLLPLVFIILFSVSEAGFIDDGVPIADGDGMQTAPLITSSPGGGAIIVWEDQAVPGTALMAQKIDGLGRYRWDPSGVRVSAGTSPQDEPSVLSDGAGGLFIAWKDGLDIYAQHLDDGGAPLWTAEGVPVCAADGEQQRPGICPGPDGGIIVCWLDSRPGAQGIYGQRLGASGLPVWAVDG